MSLELPANKTFWHAKSAEAWRDQYISAAQDEQNRQPSLVQFMFNVDALKYYDQIDKVYALYVMLFSYWGLIWNYKQFEIAINAEPLRVGSTRHSLPSLLSIQDLRRLLDDYQTIISDWRIDYPVEILIVHNFLHMSLYMSAEEHQLLSGANGETDARRVFPILREWSKSWKARQTLWHAGQLLGVMLRETSRGSATSSPSQRRRRNFFRDFYAFSIFQAGLTLWVYGLMLKIHLRENQHTEEATAKMVPMLLPGRDPGHLAAPFDIGPTLLPATPTREETYFIISNDDPVNTVDRDRFITLNRGLPAIERPNLLPPGAETKGPPASMISEKGSGNAFEDDESGIRAVALNNCKSVMDVVADVILDMSKVPQNSADSRPPFLSGTLARLLRDLGTAADDI